MLYFARTLILPQRELERSGHMSSVWWFSIKFNTVLFHSNRQGWHMTHFTYSTFRQVSDFCVTRKFRHLNRKFPSLAVWGVWLLGGSTEARVTCDLDQSSWLTRGVWCVTTNLKGKVQYSENPWGPEEKRVSKAKEQGERVAPLTWTSNVTRTNIILVTRKKKWNKSTNKLTNQLPKLKGSSLLLFRTLELDRFFSFSFHLKLGWKLNNLKVEQKLQTGALGIFLADVKVFSLGKKVKRHPIVFSEQVTSHR
jgi:hypothetical protein